MGFGVNASPYLDQDLDGQGNVNIYKTAPAGASLKAVRDHDYCAFCSAGCDPTLDENVEDLALVIDGAPEVPPPTRDPHNHLIKMPSVTRARAPSP